MAQVLSSTHGQLLYVDQLIALIRLLGFEHGWAERFRRTLAGGRRVVERNEMEQVLRAAASKRGWTSEQITGLLGLLYEHVGYLYNHGHALHLARRAYEQACLKVNPATVAKAYQRLTDSGILIVKRGEGTFVVEHPPSIPRGEREKELEGGAIRYASLAVTIGAANEEALEQVKRSLGFLRKK